MSDQLEPQVAAVDELVVRAAGGPCGRRWRAWAGLSLLLRRCPRQPSHASPGGNVPEDFLESSGMTLDEFRTQFTGSWMFAWIAALRRSRVRTVLVCVVRGLARAERTVHAPSGVPLWFLPPSRAYPRGGRGAVRRAVAAGGLGRAIAAWRPRSGWRHAVPFSPARLRRRR
jgi:hypothetical protein